MLPLRSRCWGSGFAMVVVGGEMAMIAVACNCNWVMSNRSIAMDDG